MSPQDEVFRTLQRFSSLVKDCHLIQQLSDLVDIEFAVVGGAVRDSVLDKPIKDIDILVRFNFYHNLKIHYSFSKDSLYDKSDMEEGDALERRNYQIQSVMEKDEFFAIRQNPRYPNYKFNASSALVCLTEYLIQNDLNYALGERLEKKKSSLPVNELEIKKVAYKMVGLNAVVSIVDKKVGYPVELLFTQDCIDTFIDNFDFNLCKIKMVDKDGQAEIVPNPLFTQDKNNMTMTYQPESSINEDQMNKSLVVRYERLHKKFPEYELICDVTNVNKNMKETIEQTVKSVELYHKMKNLPDKADTKKANKI